MEKKMYSVTNIGKLAKKNLVWIILLLCIFFVWYKKDISLQTDIVSHPDTVVSFSNEDTLEQTWLSDVKEIKDVGISYYSHSDGECGLQLKVLEGWSGKEVVNVIQNIEFVKGESGRIHFQFEPVKIELGQQYVFCLQYVDVKEPIVIDLDAGSNYTGCKISGTAYNVGIAFQIGFIKTSLASWLLLTLFPFMGIAFFFMTFFERKWEDTIGIAVITGIFWLWIMGMLGKLELGITLIYILAFISLVLGIYFFSKKGIEVKELLSPGVFVFGILIILILINCQELRLAAWDEFSHWGLATKDMFYSDSLAKHVGTTVMLPDYPPAVALIQYFFVYVNGVFSQKFMYVAFQFLMCSLLLVAFGKRGSGKRRIIEILASIGIIIFVPLTYFADTYNSLYVDPMLAYGVAYVLICYYREKFTKFNLIRIIGGLFLITMIKHTGLVIAGVVTLIIVGDVLYRQYCNRRWKVKEIGIALLCTFMVLLFFVTWQKYLTIPVRETTYEEVKEELVFEETVEEVVIDNVVLEERETEKVQQLVLEETTTVKNMKEVSEVEAVEEAVEMETDEVVEEVIETEAAEVVEEVMEMEVTEETEMITETEEVVVSSAVSRSGITVGRILDLLRGDGEEYQYQIIVKYVQKVFSENVFTVGPIKVSYMDFFFLIIMICVIVSKALWKSSLDNELVIYSIISLVGGIGYAGFLLITYIYTFSPGEGMAMSSYSRYLSSYSVGVLIALYVMLIEKSAECMEERKVGICIIASVMAIVLIGTPFEYFLIRNMNTELVDDEVYGFSDIEEIISSGAEREDKVYFVCNNSNGYAGLQMRNQLVPLNVYHSGYNLFASEELYLKQMEHYRGNGVEVRSAPNVLSPQDWKSQLQDYEYVVLFSINDVFREGYSSIFSNPETLDNGTVYQVNKGASELYLEYVGKAGIKNYR